MNEVTKAYIKGLEDEVKMLQAIVRYLEGSGRTYSIHTDPRVINMDPVNEVRLPILSDAELAKTPSGAIHVVVRAGWSPEGAKVRYAYHSSMSGPTNIHYYRNALDWAAEMHRRVVEEFARWLQQQRD